MDRLPAVRLYVEHFGREVVIDPDHPLAVAQYALNAANETRASGSAPTTDTLSATAPAVTVSPEPPRVPASKRSRSRQQ